MAAQNPIVEDGATSVQGTCTILNMHNEHLTRENESRIIFSLRIKNLNLYKL
jgi:hypothetical protein